jgi:hypothetical protein
LNVPRLTYQNGGGGCPSLLLEKQSTNLVTYSEDFTNAAWATNNITVSGNSVISPDGTQNADSLIFASGTDVKYIFNPTIIVGTNSMSVYLKYNNFRYIQFLIGTDGAMYANFDIQNGIIGNYSNCTPTIENIKSASAT